jgi:hypothetical protein
MQPVGTLVAFGATPAAAIAPLDATALACEVLAPGEDLFARIKEVGEAGSILLLLADSANDPALAGAAKARKILQRRGGGDAAVVLPAVPALPGPQARARLDRAARLTGACVIQPVGHASWADAVRILIEPLAIFGLVGVDPREIHGLLGERAALLQRWDDPSLDESMRTAKDVLVSCRLRPTSTLAEVDAAANRVRAATRTRLVLAGPELSRDDGPRALAAVFQ